MARTILFVMAALLAFASLSFAGCAADAYAKACASCSFDANGKIDQSCKSGYQSSGTSCLSTSYPIMSAKYAAGKCPEIDSCASELGSCASQYSSGNDSADCKEGSVGVCYSAADACTRQAAVKCGEAQNPCGAPAATILLILGAGLFLRRE